MANDWPWPLFWPILCYSQAMTNSRVATAGRWLATAWTDSVAYIALLASAGLSLAGNVADTYRVRGPATDTLDIWLAITWPLLVILMVHVFVSARWNGLSGWMQALRWLGCLAITLVAMMASWLHLNDLMASRGQVSAVATLGPLAIDFLAIMATALILAGRKARPGQADELERLLASVPPQVWENAARGVVAEIGQDVGELRGWVQDLATRLEHPAPPVWPTTLDVHGLPDPAGDPGQPDTGHTNGHDIGAEAENYLRLASLASVEDVANRPPLAVANGHTTGQEDGQVDIPLDDGQPGTVDGAASLAAAEYDAAIPGQPSGQDDGEPGIRFFPTEATERRMRELLATPGMKLADVDATVASECNVSVRTARRWRGQLANGGQSSGQDG